MPHCGLAVTRVEVCLKENLRMRVVSGEMPRKICHDVRLPAGRIAYRDRVRTRVPDAKVPWALTDRLFDTPPNITKNMRKRPALADTNQSCKGSLC